MFIKKFLKKTYECPLQIWEGWVGLFFLDAFWSAMMRCDEKHFHKHKYLLCFAKIASDGFRWSHRVVFQNELKKKKSWSKILIFNILNLLLKNFESLIKIFALLTKFYIADRAKCSVIISPLVLTIKCSCVNARGNLTNSPKRQFLETIWFLRSL